MEEFNQEDGIDILVIWRFFVKNLWMLIFAGLIGGIIASLYVVFFTEPIYQSQVQLIVNQNSQDEEIQLNQIQANERLINTYKDIVIANSTLEIVSEELNNEYSPSQIRNSLSVNQQTNSQAFNIIATSDSPEKAQMLVSTVNEVFQKQVMTAYSTNEPNIFVLSEATFNPNPVSPNILISIIIGILLGGFLCIIFLLVKELSDKTIYSKEYVENFGLVNLGEISDISFDLREESRLSQHTRKKRRRL